MNQAIISLARFQAMAGGGDELGLRLHELLWRAQQDTACLGCELLYDAHCAGCWLLRGHWSSAEALDAHLRLPHMQLLGQLMDSGLVQNMELQMEGSSPGASAQRACA
ncbi:MAG TPA: antibiotic biosynthesis monooxygenase [Pseudomonas sp.]|nr:antibiotic biosynthesis monooxygenase [Pseudomonas sp.]